MNANNINKQGFSFNDIISTMGGFSSFGGGGGGGNFGGGGSFGGGGGGGMQVVTAGMEPRASLLAIDKLLHLLLLVDFNSRNLASLLPAFSF